MYRNWNYCDVLFQPIIPNTKNSSTRIFHSENSNMNRNWASVISMAAGVGLLSGTTCVLLYHYILGRRYSSVLQQDLNRLHLSLENLRGEFEELKNLKICCRKARKNRSSAASTTTRITDASMYSAVESDLEDEFCDLSDSEDDSTFRIMSISSFSNYKTAASNMTSSSTGNISELLGVDQLLEGNDEEKVQGRDVLLEMLKKNPKDSEVLWRLAKVSHALGAIEGAKGSSKQKESLILNGIEYGQEALDYNPNSANAHKWYAICIGARGQFGSTKDKILDGSKFKEHIEKALALDDSDPTLYNLLARFEFEVSTLSSMERRVASWLFAEVPRGTVENAIAGFLKTEQLNPKPWKENRLLLAKSFILQKNYETAVNWLDKALEIPPTNSEEKNFDEEIQKLLKKYESYRKL